MLERFRLGAPKDRSVASIPQVSTVGELLDRTGGQSFEGGLYRLHNRATSAAAGQLVAAGFPEFAGRFVCFGYDWLGRQFAIDAARGSAHDPEVLMFEPGTGEALEVPVPFSEFHAVELIEQAEAALASSLYANWRTAGGAVPGLYECIGYRTPLFLGGLDDVSNLELSDIDVYWTITGQLRLAVMGLPGGTHVSGVTMEP